MICRFFTFKSYLLYLLLLSTDRMSLSILEKASVLVSLTLRRGMCPDEASSLLDRSDIPTSKNAQLSKNTVGNGVNIPVSVIPDISAPTYIKNINQLNDVGLYSINLSLE